MLANLSAVAVSSKETKEIKEIVEIVIPYAGLSDSQTIQKEIKMFEILLKSDQCPDELVFSYKNDRTASIIADYIDALRWNTRAKTLRFNYTGQTKKPHIYRADKDWENQMFTYSFINSLTVLQNNPIRNLSFRDNNIIAKDLEALAPALRGTSIVVLDLADNNIKDRFEWEDSLRPFGWKDTQNSLGIQALALSLPYTQMKGLNFWGTAIDIADVRTIVMAIPNTQVEWLGLGKNKLGNNITAFADNASFEYSLSKIRRPWSLDLRENEIGDEGAEALVQILPRTSIQYVDLRQNPISNEMLNRIEEILHSNRAIQEAILRRNRARQEREEFYWGQLALIIAFQRANAKHPLKNSIFSMVIHFMEIHHQHLNNVPRPLPRPPIAAPNTPPNTPPTMLQYWEQFTANKKLKKWQQDTVRNTPFCCIS